MNRPVKAGWHPARRYITPEIDVNKSKTIKTNRKKYM
jgi:hypothetical protein